MRDMFRRASSAVSRSWCQAMHPDPMWPINGSYQCPKCLKRYPVPWERQVPNQRLEHARLLTPAEAKVLQTRPSIGLTALPPAA